MRIVLVALLAAQLGGCAHAATRDAGTVLAGVGLLAMVFAVTPECEDDASDGLFDDDDDECDNPTYDEESMDARSALLLGGGAVAVIGGTLIGASQTPARVKRRAPPPAPVNAAPAPPPPDPALQRRVRELIEGRCKPEGDAVDLRVQREGEPFDPNAKPCSLAEPANEVPTTSTTPPP